MNTKKKVEINLHFPPKITDVGFGFVVLVRWIVSD